MTPPITTLHLSPPYGATSYNHHDRNFHQLLKTKQKFDIEALKGKVIAAAERAVDPSESAQINAEWKEVTPRNARSKRRSSPTKHWTPSPKVTPITASVASPLTARVNSATASNSVQAKELENNTPKLEKPIATKPLRPPSLSGTASAAAAGASKITPVPYSSLAFSPERKSAFKTSPQREKAPPKEKTEEQQKKLDALKSHPIGTLTKTSRMSPMLFSSPKATASAVVAAASPTLDPTDDPNFFLLRPIQEPSTILSDRNSAASRGSATPRQDLFFPISATPISLAASACSVTPYESSLTACRIASTSLPNIEPTPFKLKVGKNLYKRMLFSQDSIASTTTASNGHPSVSIDKLTTIFAEKGFPQSIAIHVVEMSRYVLTSFDNRRLYAAYKAAKIKKELQIYIYRHAWEEPRDNSAIRRDFKFLLQNVKEAQQKEWCNFEGYEMDTWGEAIQLRLRNSFKVGYEDVQHLNGYAFNTVQLRGD